MGSHETHYEVFFKPSPKRDWRLLCARSSRDAALKEAHAAVAAAPAGSVRVSKETFDPDARVFRSSVVFTAGREDPTDDLSRADRQGELPCTGPNDLVAPFARGAIARVLRAWLSRETVTPLELLHRVDLVERLEATSCELQHAVQKIAIARASESDASVQGFVKQLNELVQAGVVQLHTDTRANAFAKMKRGELAGLAARITDLSDRERRMRGAIAHRLAGAKTWQAKMERMLDVADEACAIAAKMPWALGVVSEFMGEFARADDARDALLEAPEERGDEADALSTLLRGEVRDHGLLTPPGARLAWHFTEGRFDEARTAIGARILAIIRDPRRLKRDSVMDEVAVTRRLAEQLTAMAHSGMGLDDLIPAFVARSGRLLQPEIIDELSRTCADEKAVVAALLELEANIIGDQNKTKLAAYVRARLGTHTIDRHFVSEATPILHRLADLAELHRHAMRTDFAPDDKAAIASLLEDLAQRAAEAAQLFARIEARPVSNVDKATALLRLAAKGVLPPGRLVNEAKARAKRALAAPDARAALTRDTTAARAALKEISALMASIEPVEPAA